MNIDQISHLRDDHTIAAIITTRNATFWFVDSNGTNARAQYTVESWDDQLGLVILVASERMRSDQFRTKMALNCDIIDEMILVNTTP